MEPRQMQLVWLGSVCALLASSLSLADDSATPVISLRDLPAACRRAKADFRPLGPTDIAEAKTSLAEAIDRLEARLSLAGPVGDAWRAYLELPRLKDQARPETNADAAVLRRIYSHYDRDADGLDLVWFVDVKEAIAIFLVRRVATTSSDQRRNFEEKIDLLATVLESYITKPNERDALLLGEGQRWLSRTQQARSITQAIEAHFLRPNLYFEISADLVRAALTQPFNDTSPVQDYVLGTTVHGTGRTVGHATAELSPHDSLGVFDVVFEGITTNEDIGYNGPVTILSTSTSRLVARKRFWIDIEGTHCHPTAGKATANIDIHDIQANGFGSRLIERIAWRRADRLLGEAEWITARHTAARLNAQIDQLAAAPMREGNETYREFRQALVDRKLFAQDVRFHTTERAITISAVQAGGGKIAAPDAPPAVAPGADFSLCIHESALNNLAIDTLAGRTVRDGSLPPVIAGAIGDLSPTMLAESSGKGEAMTFSHRRPVSIRFADGAITITLHGTSFRGGKMVYPDRMDISATYKINKSQNGFAATRQGIVQVNAPGSPPITPVTDVLTTVRKLLFQQIARGALQKRFSSIFDREISNDDLSLPAEWKSLGALRLIQFDARNGWLVIAGKRSPASTEVPILARSPK